MNKVFGIVAATLVATASVALAGSVDQGRRLTGPFCINKTTGVVRSVALLHTGTCKATENRATGVGVAAPKGDKGEKGDPGKNGQDGSNGNTGATGVAGATGETGPTGPRGYKGDKGDPGTPAPTLLRLTGDFSGSNATVATSLDGVTFGPYPDGGAWGGSVVYTGANGLKLNQITQLSYTVDHSSANDSPIAAPYLRIFLDGDTHDVIFDPTQCASTVPAEDVFNTYEVTTGDVRYDDDSCDGVAPDQQSWATVVAAHGNEVVSGIYVTTGFAGGAPLSAILRSLKVDGTSFVFGSA